MAVHNADGARFLENLGFSRVVLARELSLPKLKQSVGKPLLPSRCLSTARSACAYPECAICPLFWAGVAGTVAMRSAMPAGFPCRHKAVCAVVENMSHLYAIKDLVSVGVSSFKIEGRMKRPGICCGGSCGLQRCPGR